LVVRDGFRLTLIGLAVGLLVSLGFTAILTKVLYGLTPAATPVFVAVIVLLTGVAGVACYLPARRATKGGPMVVLRGEGGGVFFPPHSAAFRAPVGNSRRALHVPEEQFLALTAQVADVADVVAIAVDVVENDAARRRPLDILAQVPRRESAQSPVCFNRPIH